MKYTLNSEFLPEKLQTAGLNVMAVSATELELGYLQQIIGKSLQPHIQEYEGPEDTGTAGSPGRFRSIDDYEKWAENKQRLLFLLLNPSNLVGAAQIAEVAAISWFGKREHPQAPGRSVTFAMRSYAADTTQGWAQYAGRGLAIPFMNIVHKEASNEFEGSKLWLDLVANNEASRMMCIRSGYRELIRFYDDTHGGEERIVMVNDTAFISDQSLLTESA